MYISQLYSNLLYVIQFVIISKYQVVFYGLFKELRSTCYYACVINEGRMFCLTWHGI